MFVPATSALKLLRTRICLLLEGEGLIYRLRLKDRLREQVSTCKVKNLLGGTRSYYSGGISGT